MLEFGRQRKRTVMIEDKNRSLFIPRNSADTHLGIDDS